MRRLITASLLVAFSNVAFAQATKPGTYYVKENVLEERPTPSNKGSITNRIYRGQKVNVFELKNGWARVSKYYDGSVESQSGQVARWVLATGLSTKQPEDLKQPDVPNDPRIAKDAFPKVGQSGLTEQDIQILYKGALKHLNSGKCARVEYGDKSTSKANTYYINCGGPANIFSLRLRSSSEAAQQTVPSDRRLVVVLTECGRTCWGDSR